eukprot:jgi/Tetstr1/459357/TSEL_000426.t1
MAASDADGTWLCKVEEMRAHGAQQVGQSACGPTAIINVLRAAGVKRIPSPDAVLKTCPARQRDYDTRSLHGYLLSRVKAGTTHADLIEGVSQLSGGEVSGRLFVVDSHASPEALSEWLAGWIAGGGVPMLTLNLFLDGKDAFHHQSVFGVEKGGDVWTSNPVMKYKPAHLLSLITGSGHMVIPKEHILWRFQEAFKDGTAQAFLSEVERLDREEPWMRFGVGSQINRMLANLTQGQPEDNWKRRFSDLVIPWGGIPGVVVFARKGTKAMRELEAICEDHVDIAMPVYGSTERVPVALHERVEDDAKRGENAKLAATLALAQEEKHSLKELLAAEAAAKRRLETNLEAERGERVQVAERLSKQQSASEQLQGRLQAAIADSAQLANRLEAADAEGEQLRESLQGARAEAAQLKQRAAQLEAKVQHRDTQLEEARAEVQQLRTELQTQCQDTSSLAQEMADLVNEYKAQARLSGDSARKVEEMSAELSFLRAQQHGDRAKALEERKQLLGTIEDLKRKLHVND